MNILDWIGYVFGYVIYFGYQISGAYVIGLILFTIVVKLVMLPMSLNQQRTNAKQARIQPKIRELQEIYRNNPTRLQEEQQALYARENISLFGGCLPMLIQLPVIFGLYRAIMNPLTNVLHLSVDKVNKLIELSGVEVGKNGYIQSEIINLFPKIRDQVEAAGIFTANELAKLEQVSDGAFTLFGLNLLEMPSWSSLLLLIPVCCFISSMAMTLLTMKNTAAAEQSGCAKWTTPVMMSALTTWLAFSVPGAVGLYWIIQNLVGMVERALLNKFYNGDIMEAADEAGRYARRELEEQKVMERFANVDIRAAAQRLKERTDAEAAEKMSEKNAKTASIYDSIDAKNVIVVNNNNNDRVIKTGNVARAGGSKSKKKKK
ncbi:MAG: YidC/Oxa1 family membrane protein insertase [Clostridia bacterium]|nr:YidC/Oxa1 family membrane protein insertase [Clostridia bacterium]